MMVADKFPNGLIGPIGLNPNGPIGPIGPIFPINSTSISKINLLSEGRRVLHSAKIPTMGCTKRTAHCRDFF